MSECVISKIGDNISIGFTYESAKDMVAKFEHYGNVPIVKNFDDRDIIGYVNNISIIDDYIVADISFVRDSYIDTLSDFHMVCGYTYDNILMSISPTMNPSIDNYPTIGGGNDKI